MLGHQRSFSLTCFVFLIGSGLVEVCFAQNLRNYKTGLSFTKAHACGSLAPHTSASWWYSWSAESNGFHGGEGSFCAPDNEAVAAVNTARQDGMDFVPMFWGGVPAQPFSADLHENLVNAKYLMGFNEPEFQNQANISPEQAAQLWPQVVAIANTYNLQLTGPCSEAGGHGRTWYASWTAACQAMYGAPCEYDFTCIHIYMHPSPCAPGIESWACIGDENGSRANGTLNWWYDTYGKEIWVTEYGCPEWGHATDSEYHCSEEDQRMLMRQLTSVLESSSIVYRYAWYTMFNTQPEWVGSALNEPGWTAIKGSGCVNKIWLGGFGTAGWQIQTYQECISLALANSNCSQPLSLLIDDDNCQCASDSCPTLSVTYPAMTTYQQVNGPDGGNIVSTAGILYNEITAPPPTTLRPTPQPTPGPSSQPTPVPTPTSSSCTEIIDKPECDGRSDCAWTGNRRRGSCGDVDGGGDPPPTCGGTKGHRETCSLDDECTSCVCGKKGCTKP